VDLKKTVVALVAGIALSGGSVAAAAEKEELRLTHVGSLIVPMAPPAEHEAKVERPAMLPALYASLGAMQAWDIYSTRAAVKAGAREGNLAAKPFAGHAGAMLGLKAATTAGTIYFAERMWKKNKVGAIVMLAVVNGATAAVAMRNMRNVRAAAVQ
jgi:hypothetical protein